MPLKDNFIDGDFYTAAHINAVAAAVNSLDADATLGMFNVKAYGAIGDSVTDDAPAIQAAIDAAQVGGFGGGGVIYFPPGQYHISSTLLIKESFVTLTGASAGSAMILVDAASTFPAVTFDGHVNGVAATPTDNNTWAWNFTVRDLWFEKGTPVVNTAPAISLHSVNNPFLQNLNIRGFGTGVLVTGAVGVNAYRVLIQSNSAATVSELYGWLFDSTYPNWSAYISHCTAGFGGENVTAVTSYGYYNDGRSDWFIDHCEAGSCTYGFYWAANGSNTEVTDIHFVECVADQCQYGFAILDNLINSNIGQVDIDSCYWANRFTSVVPTPNGYGVAIANSSGATVRGFQSFSGNPGDPTHYQNNYGIWVLDSKDVSITGANIKGNHVQGILVERSEYVTIFGNTILQTMSIDANGIALVNGTDASIVGNTIRSLTGLATPMTNGIYVNAHGGVVIGNNVVDSATVTNELNVTGGAAVSAVNNIGFADYP